MAFYQADFKMVLHYSQVWFFWLDTKIKNKIKNNNEIHNVGFSILM